MQVGVCLEPAGEQAEAIMSQWLKERGLTVNGASMVDIRPELCLDELADLRCRCYGQGLIINATFVGNRD